MISRLLRICLPLLAPAAACAAPPEQFAQVFGEKIRYYDAGTGPTLVLLHGMGSSALGDWGRCFDALAAHHRVVAIDQLGFGGSDKPQIDYRVQIWVDFLGEFLRQRKITAFALAGESLGGWVAALYTSEALNDPPPGPTFVLPRPIKLILADAAGHRALCARMLAGDVPDGNTIAGAKTLLGQVFHGASWHTDEAVRNDLAWSMSKGDAWTMRSFSSNRQNLGDVLDDRLAGIHVPTLVVWGAEDTLVPLADGRDFAARIPGARLAVLPNCAHAACIEDPPAFLAAVLAFLGP